MNEVKKTFLECMFGDLNDISEGTEEEVIKELEAMGIDIEEAEPKFRKFLSELVARKKEDEIPQ